jgi:hypothetical protein
VADLEVAPALLEGLVRAVAVAQQRASVALELAFIDGRRAPRQQRLPSDSVLQCVVFMQFLRVGVTDAGYLTPDLGTGSGKPNYLSRDAHHLRTAYRKEVLRQYCTPTEMHLNSNPTGFPRDAD